MKASFTSNKGALARLIGAVRLRAETCVAIKWPASATTTLSEAYNKFLTKCDFLH